MKNLFTLFILLISISISQAQYAGNNVYFSWSSYIEVPHNLNGDLNIGEGFTIEQWIKADGVIDDQKTFSKIGHDFLDGYVLGIQDGQIKFEVFDSGGTKYELIAGFPTAGQWFHLAAVCSPEEFLKLYINGELVGETSMSASNISYNTNILKIGSESWEFGAGFLNFDGNIDESRYFKAVLPQDVIQHWMLRDLNNAHPNWDDLKLYHKCNETDGIYVSDTSPSAYNHGALSTGASLTGSTMPFNDVLLDGFEFTFELNGIWGSRTTATSDIFTLTAGSLESDNSVVFANDYGSSSLIYYPVDDFEKKMSRNWRVVTNGAPLADVQVDLSFVSFSDYNTVAVLKSDDTNFYNATVFEGTLIGNSLSVPDVIFENGYYYTLGFGNVTSVEAIEDRNNEMELYPNPSNGQFTLEWKGVDLEDAQVIVRNIAGKVVYLDQFISTDQQQINISDHAKGMYLVQIVTTDRIISKKITVQ